MRRAKDSSGREIFTETDLPQTQLSCGTIASIIDVDQGWAHVRLLGWKMYELENILKEEATEFLRSAPRVKQVFVYQRAG